MTHGGDGERAKRTERVLYTDKKKHSPNWATPERHKSSSTH